jgi:hypothetical protein
MIGLFLPLLPSLSTAPACTLGKRGTCPGYSSNKAETGEVPSKNTTFQRSFLPTQSPQLSSFIVSLYSIIIIIIIIIRGMI